MLGKCPIKWRQRAGMTIAVDCDAKNAQMKQSLISVCMYKIYISLQPPNMWDVNGVYIVYI